MWTVHLQDESCLAWSPIVVKSGPAKVVAGGAHGRFLARNPGENKAPIRITFYFLSPHFVSVDPSDPQAHSGHRRAVLVRDPPRDHGSRLQLDVDGSGFVGVELLEIELGNGIPRVLDREPVAARGRRPEQESSILPYRSLDQIAKVKLASGGNQEHGPGLDQLAIGIPDSALHVCARREHELEWILPRKIDRAFEGRVVGMSDAERGRTVLGKMDGEYRLEAMIHPRGESPGMQTTPRESYRMIFGGTVQERHFVDERRGNESFHYAAWNPTEKCYDTMSIGDTGQLVQGQIRTIDERTRVETFFFMRSGEPFVGRGILICDEAGLPVQWDSDLMIAAEDPRRAFSGEYWRIR